MKFLGTFACVLVLLLVLMLFGGLTLFDFQAQPYVALILWALMIAAVASIFEAQEEKIDKLEKRVETLEKELQDKPE